MEDQPRAHGFRWPLHPLQVVSWVVFGTDVLVFCIFCIPLLETIVQVIVSVCFGVSVVVLVIATFIATKCDPMDPFVLRDESQFRDEELDELPYCGLCAKTVQARSKHCRVCKKCVGDFDHHCMWLNNCIGGDNYRAFFTSISSVAVMVGILLGTVVYQFIDFATDEAFELRMEASAIHRNISREVFLVILVGLSVVNVPLWALDMQLVLLHTYLVHQGLTTYEYITNKREETRFGLPHWMDWIVFSRCGRRKSKKKTSDDKKSEAAGSAAEAPEAPEAPDEAPQRAGPSPQVPEQVDGPSAGEALQDEFQDQRPADQDEVTVEEPPALVCGCEAVSRDRKAAV